MIYPIVKYGQPVLEQVGDIITEFDTPELTKLVEDMFESMYAAKGVGLAAPQRLRWGTRVVDAPGLDTTHTAGTGAALGVSSGP